MNTIKIAINAESLILKATLRTPDPSVAPRALIIFTHGLGYCERQYNLDFEYFVKRGYAVLSYTLRGHAGTGGDWTLERSVSDLISVVDFIDKYFQSYTKPSIGVMGHSTGSLISILAATRDKRIQFGSFITTVTCLRHSFEYWFQSGYNKDVKELFRLKGVLPDIIAKFMDDPEQLRRFMTHSIPAQELDVPHRYGMLKSSSWGTFFKEIAFTVDILAELKAIEIPGVYFRGKSDEVMSPLKTDALYNLASRQTCSKLLVTDSTDHFQNGSWHFIQRETLNFFDAIISSSSQMAVKGAYDKEA